MLQATVTIFTVQERDRLQKFSKLALSLIGYCTCCDDGYNSTFGTVLFLPIFLVPGALILLALLGVPLGTSVIVVPKDTKSWLVCPRVARYVRQWKPAFLRRCHFWAICSSRIARN